MELSKKIEKLRKKKGIDNEPRGLRTILKSDSGGNYVCKNKSKGIFGVTI